MNEKDFKELIKLKFKELQIEIQEKQIMQFYQYMNLLMEWNDKINLTSIIEPKEIIEKHFIDSLTVIKQIEKHAKIIDIGTGAGFPGIPIKIIYPEAKIILVDSLRKRINFLNTVINEIALKDVKTIHSRAEDLGKDIEYREKFDISIARAVSPLNTLIEYLIPFVKISGKCICMKGPNSNDEIEKSERAIRILGGEIEKIEEFVIPETQIRRKIIIIKKIVETDKKYPRKAGIPSKNPL